MSHEDSLRVTLHTKSVRNYSDLFNLWRCISILSNGPWVAWIAEHPGMLRGISHIYWVREKGRKGTSASIVKYRGKLEPELITIDGNTTYHSGYAVRFAIDDLEMGYSEEFSFGRDEEYYIRKELIIDTDTPYLEPFLLAFGFPYSAVQDLRKYSERTQMYIAREAAIAAELAAVGDLERSIMLGELPMYLTVAAVDKINSGEIHVSDRYAEANAKLQKIGEPVNATLDELIETFPKGGRGRSMLCLLLLEVMGIFYDSMRREVAKEFYHDLRPPTQDTDAWHLLAQLRDHILTILDARAELEKVERASPGSNDGWKILRNLRIKLGLERDSNQHAFALSRSPMVQTGPRMASSEPINLED